MNDIILKHPMNGVRLIGKSDRTMLITFWRDVMMGVAKIKRKAEGLINQGFLSRYQIK